MRRSNGTQPMTRFSRLHPYPAMVADTLAIELSRQYVSRGDKVLDPFCGTSRTLIAAAEYGAHVVGFDVNPLAIMVSNAKGARYNIGRLQLLREKVMRREFTNGSSTNVDLEFGRRVKWFSTKARRELMEIIS